MNGTGGIDVRRAFASDASGPVTIVFATCRFRGVVEAWIQHARRAGCRNYRIVCMDRDLLDALRGEGDRTVHFWDVLPDAPEESINLLPEAHERLARITRLRTKFFLHLVAHGIDFLHSDADALWLGDPRPWLLDSEGYDLLFSQGTTHPWTHFKATGFTACAGFFFARASARTRRFFEAAERMAAWQPNSDQARFNEVLLRDRSGRWEIEAPRLALAPSHGHVTRKGDPVSRRWRYAQAKPRIHALGAWALGTRGVGFWTRATLRVGGRICMVTSAEVMTGRFADGLTVGVIPMRLIERVPLADRGEALVYHLGEIKRRWLRKGAR